MVANNPTGYVLVMNTYVQTADETETKSIFKLIGGTKASMAGSGDSSWEGMEVTSPYPLTRPFDAQRKAALRASDTLYCYDIPALFEAVIEQVWNRASSSNFIATNGQPSSRPIVVMNSIELVVKKKVGFGTGAWNGYCLNVYFLVFCLF